jgi:hypothetical protein
MDTKIDDLTGQQIDAKMAYKIKIVQPDKSTLEIDCAYTDQVKNLVSVAVSNGQRWFKWKKTESGQLTKVYPDEGGF